MKIGYGLIVVMLLCGCGAKKNIVIAQATPTPVIEDKIDFDAPLPTVVPTPVKPLHIDYNIVNTANFGSLQIRKGDCLWKIAKRAYINPFLWPLLWDANWQTVGDPNKIKAYARLDFNKTPTKDECDAAIMAARRFR